MAVFSLICIIIEIVFINYSMYRGLGLPLACIIGTIFIYITSYNIRVVVFKVPLQELHKNAIL